MGVVVVGGGKLELSVSNMDEKGEKRRGEERRGGRISIWNARFLEFIYATVSVQLYYVSFFTVKSSASFRSERLHRRTIPWS